jgi:hypothetical protein
MKAGGLLRTLITGIIYRKPNCHSLTPKIIPDYRCCLIRSRKTISHRQKNIVKFFPTTDRATHPRP